MNRRKFLEVTKDLGVVGALGIPLLDADGILKGGVVDVTFSSESVIMFHDFTLFVDVPGDRLGVIETPQGGSRMQVSLSAAIRAIRFGEKPVVRMETKSDRGRQYDGVGDPAVLFADRRSDEFGFRSPENGSERVTVPLTDVVRLLERAKVL